MKIRRATPDDAAAIHQIHTRAVLALCGEAYAPEQLATWAGYSTVAMQQRRLQEHRAFVAEQDGVVIGFVRWAPATSELCSIYVDPDYARQGVASRLMAQAEADALSLGVAEFWLDASLTAVPFYQATGWQTIKPMTHRGLACLRMTKQLVPQEKVD
jgi:predicted N-acetyltransferase YhbS